MNTNNGVKWRRFIVPKKVKQINDTYKSNKLKVGVNDMTVNDSEMCEMKKRSLVNTGDIGPEIAYTRVRGRPIHVSRSGLIICNGKGKMRKFKI